jgi:hypothetical protein
MAVQVLVVLDGSEVPEGAVAALGRLSFFNGSTRVEVLHALEARAGARRARAGTSAQELEMAWSYVRRQAQRLTLPGVQATASLVLGSIDQTMSERLSRGGFRHVFVAARPGTRQRDAIDNMLARQVDALARLPNVVDVIEPNPAQPERRPAMRLPARLIA